MPAYVIQIDGYDPVAAAAVTLRASSVDDERVCHLNGQTWWPQIATLPALRYDLVDGGFSGRIDTPSSNIAMAVEAWPDFPRYALGDARVRLWSGEPGEAWASWMLRFDGRLTAQPSVSDGVAQMTIAVDERWLDTPLLPLYTGTGGAEGDAALKGQPKWLALGAPRYCPARLIDSVNNVLQLSAFQIEDVEAAFERLLGFGASVGDFASYAALVAANVPAGRWATAEAVGMVRHGAPPVPGGRFVYHVRGDKAGPDGWVRLPGSIIKRLALLAGGAGKIHEASLAALNVDRPYNLSWHLREQITAREAIQRIAASVNAVVGVTWTGQLFAKAIPTFAAAATMTLDAAGTSLPPVARVDQIEIDPPYWRLAIEAERTEDVHRLDEIAFTAQLVDTGPYVSTRTYREGNISQHQQLSWLYISATPSAGNAPPTLPATSNSWWKALEPKLSTLADDIASLEAIVDGKVASYFQTSIPTAGAAGDLWYKTDTGKWYRAAVAGADQIASGEWVLVEDAGIAEAIADAATAQATADGKVVTFLQATAPTAEGVGDLWIDSDEVPKRIRRWSGSAWVVVTPASLAELDSAAASQIASLDAAIDGKVTTYFQASTPTADAVGDLWFKTDSLKWYRAASAGADQIVAGEWVLVEDGGVPQAIAAAATAQATADSKVVTFYQASAPTALGVGDLWVDSDETPKRVRRWSGSAWVVMTPASLAELDAAAAAAIASHTAALSAAADDNVLNVAEKVGSLIPTAALLEARYGELTARATAIGVSTTAATNARTNWLIYLGSLSPAYNNVTQPTTLHVSAFADMAFPAGWSQLGTANPTANGIYTTVSDDSAAAFEGLLRTSVPIAAGATVTASIVIKKDAVAGSTRQALLRLTNSGGTARSYDLVFDTSTGAYTTAHGSHTPASAWVLELNANEWIAWVTGAMAGDTTAAQVQLLPAARASGDAGTYVAARTGSVDVRSPTLSVGQWYGAGREIMRWVLKTYSEALDELAKAISEKDGVTSLQIDGDNAISIDATYTGDASASLPASFAYTAKIGTATVTTSAAWSRTVLEGSVTCTIGAATGTLQITAIGSKSATVRIDCTYSGVSQSRTVTITRLDAAPPASGGGGSTPGGASTSSFSTVNSGTWTTIATLTITAASAAPSLSAPLTVRTSDLSPVAGPWNIEMKWVRENGVTDVDVGASANSDPDPEIQDLSDGVLKRKAGTVTCNVADSGRTVGSSYTYYLMARITSGPTPRSHYFTGTASITS